MQLFPAGALTDIPREVNDLSEVSGGFDSSQDVLIRRENTGMFYSLRSTFTTIISGAGQGWTSNFFLAQLHTWSIREANIPRIPSSRPKVNDATYAIRQLVRQAVLSWFYRWGKWDSEAKYLAQSHAAEVAGIWTQACLPVLSTTHTATVCRDVDFWRCCRLHILCIFSHQTSPSLAFILTLGPRPGFLVGQPRSLSWIKHGRKWSIADYDQKTTRPGQAGPLSEIAWEKCNQGQNHLCSYSSGVWGATAAITSIRSAGLKGPSDLPT